MKLGSFNLFLGSTSAANMAHHILHGGGTTLYFVRRLAKSNTAPLPAGTLLLSLCALPPSQKLNEFGVSQMGLSCVCSFLLIDALLYYLHRMMHWKWLYRSIHKWHHRYKEPTAYSATAMHPAEFIMFQTVLALPAFVVPMHAGAYILLLAYTFCTGLIDHSGVELKSFLPWDQPAREHDQHHEHFHCNFGHFTNLWDKLHRTSRQPVCSLICNVPYSTQSTYCSVSPSISAQRQN